MSQQKQCVTKQTTIASARRRRRMLLHRAHSPLRLIARRFPRSFKRPSFAIPTERKPWEKPLGLKKEQPVGTMLSVEADRGRDRMPSNCLVEGGMREEGTHVFFTLPSRCLLCRTNRQSIEIGVVQVNREMSGYCLRCIQCPRVEICYYSSS